MKLYGISLTRNGQIENNQFMNSIVNTGHVTWDESGNAIDTTDVNAFKYFVAFPVPVPSGTGSWFENVTQNKVDTTGLLPLENNDSLYNTTFDTDGSFNNYFGPIVPGLKYGFDPKWNLVDSNTYTITLKSGQTGDIDGTHYGFPKPLNIGQAVIFKKATTIAKRIIAIYNDSDTELTNVKVKIADQTLKGAICEIYPYYNMSDAWYYEKPGVISIAENMMNNMAALDLVKTDGSNYGPDYAKFWFTDDLTTLEPQTGDVHEEININYLGPAGTKEAWAFAVVSQYVTVENGNYAGTDDDYMVIATETNAY